MMIKSLHSASKYQLNITIKIIIDSSISKQIGKVKVRIAENGS